MVSRDFLRPLLFDVRAIIRSSGEKRSSCRDSSSTCLVRARFGTRYSKTRPTSAANKALERVTLLTLEPTRAESLEVPAACLRNALIHQVHDPHDLALGNRLRSLGPYREAVHLR